VGAADVAAPRVIARRARDEAAERREVIEGLLAVPARLSPKYFYDELGCALYGAICQLPEYYPTRTELALFGRRRAEIAQAVGRGRVLVDLGAGDCRKAEGWFASLAPRRYVAVDIAASEIERALARMARDHPGIEMLGVATDFSRSLELDGALGEGPFAFFYPGSSIGNFTPGEAREFLAGIRGRCDRGGGLLIGVDGKKDAAVLDAAYDDALGVTAAFNLNCLRHLNHRFGFDFDIGSFIHRGFYNEAMGRVEMHLEARREHEVRLGEARRTFRSGERIHTENSYKYGRDEFERLLRDAGFARIQAWESDSTPYYVFYAS
jgi:dimethylhistidine N-methyltransferase